MHEYPRPKKELLESIKIRENEIEQLRNANNILSYFDRFPAKIDNILEENKEDQETKYKASQSKKFSQSTKSVLTNPRSSSLDKFPNVLLFMLNRNARTLMM